jgi:hypothetical protein
MSLNFYSKIVLAAFGKTLAAFNVQATKRMQNYRGTACTPVHLQFNNQSHA